MLIQLGLYTMMKATTFANVLPPRQLSKSQSEKQRQGSHWTVPDRTLVLQVNETDRIIHRHIRLLFTRLRRRHCVPYGRVVPLPMFWIKSCTPATMSANGSWPLRRGTALAGFGTGRTGALQGNERFCFGGGKALGNIAGPPILLLVLLTNKL